MSPYSLPRVESEMATIDPSPDKIEAISCNRSGVMRRCG